MGKGYKVVVCGMASVGKTAILEQVLYGNHSVGAECYATIEDVYVAVVDTDRGVKEQLRLYDTKGIQEKEEFPKHYFSIADGFVLVYAANSLESFEMVDFLKKEIDKLKDKKEYVVAKGTNVASDILAHVFHQPRHIDLMGSIVVLGNKSDLMEERQVESEVAQQWARVEKVKLWEVMATDGNTLVEPFTVLASKLSQPQNKPAFPLPGRKTKGNNDES